MFRACGLVLGRFTEMASRLPRVAGHSATGSTRRRNRLFAFGCNRTVCVKWLNFTIKIHPAFWLASNPNCRHAPCSSHRDLSCDLRRHGRTSHSGVRHEEEGQPPRETHIHTSTGTHSKTEEPDAKGTSTIQPTFGMTRRRVQPTHHLSIQSIHDSSLKASDNKGRCDEVRLLRAYNHAVPLPLQHDPRRSNAAPSVTAC